MSNRHAPIAHASAMRQVLQFAEINGLDLKALCPPDLGRWLGQVNDADWVPATVAVDVMQAAALGSGRADLGVAFAMWSNLRGYGPVSLLWDHCSTIDEANRITRRYLHLESSALRTHTELDGDDAAIRHLLMVPARWGGSQFLEATLTLELRIIRMILGEDWQPLRLELEHSAPDNYRYHQTVFRCPIEFGAERCAIILPRADLHRPSVRGNTNVLRFIEQQLLQTDALWPDDFLSQVRHLISASLVRRSANLDHVARQTGLSRQSVQRRLAEHGVSFSELLEEVRKRVAEEYFRTAPRPNLAVLAHRLGYSEASAASRFLRQCMSTGARSLRRRGQVRSDVRRDGPQ